jgi:hypothetical protein
VTFFLALAESLYGVSLKIDDFHTDLLHVEVDFSMTARRHPSKVVQKSDKVVTTGLFVDVLVHRAMNITEEDFVMIV